MMAIDNAQEALVPVRGFLQITQLKMRKPEWEMWLPSPWDVCPLLGGLDGNKEFEEAVIKALSLDHSLEVGRSPC